MIQKTENSTPKTRINTLKINTDRGHQPIRGLEFDLFKKDHRPYLRIDAYKGDDPYIEVIFGGAAASRRH